MEDVKFVLRSFAVTILIVFLMQIRVGSHTIEAHSVAWMQNSAVTEVLRGVASGAVRVGTEAYDWICQQLGYGSPSRSSRSHAADAKRGHPFGGGSARDVDEQPAKRSRFRWNGESKEAPTPDDQID